MNRPLLLCALLIAELSGPTAYAQVIASSAELAATEIVQLAYKPSEPTAEGMAKFEQSFRDSIDKNPNLAAVLKQRPDALVAGLSAAKFEYLRQYRATGAPEITQTLANVYLANFTGTELEEMRAYYRTSQAQAFLASFRKNPADNAAARNDPIVVAYRASALGLRENALNETIATELVSRAVRINQRITPLVRGKVISAMNAVLAKPRKR